jgi:amino acid transporter
LFVELKNFFIGRAQSHEDSRIFRKLSLIVFFAWVGLGSDGLSSSCYGPEEAFLALNNHTFLGIFVAIASGITVYVISSSYSQTIDLFPAGGGGYLVASKLLSPALGMVSGCALMVDYVLTITISIASGSDALFSFLPHSWLLFRFPFAIIIVIILIILNMRGIKESIVPLIPIFLTFIATHVFAILYAFIHHIHDFDDIANSTVIEVRNSVAELGIFGTIVLVMRAYSMGAGTYTGIEAVSNGIPVLREPKVQTARKTMHYMAASLTFMVVGLMLGYLFYKVQYQHGRTLNAVLLESITSDWNSRTGYVFVLITLISEAVLLFVAAQTGFLDGPRVLANMAIDKWFPSRFSNLSDRFVTQNGILLMGSASLILMILTRGSVRYMVVLYSINVFITFFLSQLGMVRHWWQIRKVYNLWLRKAFINGIGLLLTAFILAAVIIIKFHEGGWITIIITGSVILLAVTIKHTYNQSLVPLKRLNTLVEQAHRISVNAFTESNINITATPDTSAKTAVLLVSRYNGMGLHALFNIPRIFGDTFKNYIFVLAGQIDAANFKGVEEIEKLKIHTRVETDHYVRLMQSLGYYAEGYSVIGTDAVEQLYAAALKILKKYPNAIFFGGQMVFPKDTYFSRLLHNYATFALQRKFYLKGIPFIIMPVRV